LKLFERCLLAIDKVSSYVVIGLMAVLTVVIIIQVVLRYFFNESLDWSWVVPRICFVWIIFLAIPLGIKRGVHASIDIVPRLLPERVRILLYRLLTGCLIILMMVVTYNAILIAQKTWHYMMPLIDISLANFYVAIVISGIHSTLHFVRLIWTGPPLSSSFDIMETSEDSLDQ
jgi:TRAP-type C4-dicarboxylate transport system permease small subunit